MVLRGTIDKEFYGLCPKIVCPVTRSFDNHFSSCFFNDKATEMLYNKGFG